MLNSIQLVCLETETVISFCPFLFNWRWNTNRPTMQSKSGHIVIHNSAKRLNECEDNSRSSEGEKVDNKTETNKEKVCLFPALVQDASAAKNRIEWRPSRVEILSKWSQRLCLLGFFFQVSPKTISTGSQVHWRVFLLSWPWREQKLS